jgi:hypothetical protein
MPRIAHPGRDKPILILHSGDIVAPARATSTRRLAGGRNDGELVARRHGVAPNQLFTWRRLAAQGSLTAAIDKVELCEGKNVIPAWNRQESSRHVLYERRGRYEARDRGSGRHYFCSQPEFTRGAVILCRI